MKKRNVKRQVEYHGIIIDKSQIDKAIFKRLRITGVKRILMRLVTLYKIEVSEDSINEIISALQANMSTRFLFIKQEYYAHFYKADELIIVYRDKVFTVTPSPSTWTEAIRHGRSLGISSRQLDFIPNRFEDEKF